MAPLRHNREAALPWVQEALGFTSGNVDSHLARLADAGHVEQGRALTARGFQARVRITPAGDAAFGRHLAALREVLDADVPYEA